MPLGQLIEGRHGEYHWKALFTQITVILCFLHALLTIRDRATTTLGDAFTQVQKRVWEAYHTPSKRAFSQRLRRWRAWAETALPDGVMKFLDRAFFHAQYFHGMPDSAESRVRA